MKIPWQQLPSDTLEKMLEEIVTRDGTDYGVAEKTTAQKVKSALGQLASGRAHLFWDSELESASLLSADQIDILEKEHGDRNGKLPPAM